jgi:hypothetical protein
LSVESHVQLANANEPPCERASFPGRFCVHCRDVDVTGGFRFEKGGVMKENKKKMWMELCEQAADEQDPTVLILQINSSSKPRSCV